MALEKDRKQIKASKPHSSGTGAGGGQGAWGGQALLENPAPNHISALLPAGTARRRKAASRR